MKQGWIKVERSLLDWEWYDDINTKVLFLHCLLKANHAEKKYRGDVVKRGTFFTGRDLLAMETGLTAQQVRTSLKKLKSTNELTIKASRQGSVIEVVNYHKYQSTTNEVTSAATNEQPTSNQQVTSNKNDKKEKNEKNKTSDDVERVWNHYPNKQGKKSAIKGIIRAIENHGVEEIIRRVIAYAKLTDPKYYAHGSTYFNGDRYEDDLTPPKQTPQQMRGY